MSPYHAKLQPRQRQVWHLVPTALKTVLFVAICAGAAPGQQADNDSAQKPAADDRSAEDLAKRLISGESTGKDAMSRIIERMAIVERQLTRAFDAGPGTQRIQRQITDELDRAIRAAIRRSSRGATGAGAVSEARRRRPNPKTGGQGGEQTGAGAAADRPGDAGSPRQTDQDVLPGGRFRELRRGWGHLPARDRDEVIQGATERSLEKFRNWIDRYYRALAEGDQR